MLVLKQACVLLFKTHPWEARRGHPQLCERLCLQAGAGPGGQYGPEAVGPSGLPAAAEAGGGAGAGDGTGRADGAGRVAQGPFPAVRRLPPLAGYTMGSTLTIVLLALSVLNPIISPLDQMTPSEVVSSSLSLHRGLVRTCEGKVQLALEHGLCLLVFLASGLALYSCNFYFT